NAEPRSLVAQFLQQHGHRTARPPAARVAAARGSDVVVAAGTPLGCRSTRAARREPAARVGGRAVRARRGDAAAGRAGTASRGTSRRGDARVRRGALHRARAARQRLIRAQNPRSAVQQIKAKVRVSARLRSATAGRVSSGSDVYGTDGLVAPTPEEWKSVQKRTASWATSIRRSSPTRRCGINGLRLWHLPSPKRGLRISNKWLTGKPPPASGLASCCPSRGIDYGREAVFSRPRGRWDRAQSIP